MKKIVTLILILIPVIINAQEKITITGTVPTAQYEGSRIFLKYFDKQDIVDLDTSVINNEKFSFELALKDLPDVGILVLDEKQSDMLPSATFIILEPGVINVSIDKVSKISGGKKNNEFQTFFEKQNKVLENLKGNPQEQEKYITELKGLVYDYLKPNMQNNIGEFFLLNTAQLLDPYQVIELIHLSRNDFQESPQIKRAVKSLLSTQKQPEINDKYIDLTLKNENGENISLSNYVSKNKYTLIDFWASWCAPCHKEIPTLAEAYKKYKDRGFEIVGISLDEKEEQWHNTISQKKLTWPQMSDLGGWTSEAALEYQIQAIPLVYLVDNEGTIVAKNLRGPQLLNKLEELFK